MTREFGLRPRTANDFGTTFIARPARQARAPARATRFQIVLTRTMNLRPT